MGNGMNMYSIVLNADFFFTMYPSDFVFNCVVIAGLEKCKKKPACNHYPFCPAVAIHEWTETSERNSQFRNSIFET